MRAAWAACKILTRLGMLYGTTPTALQKTQLVIILWHKLTDIVTLREILVNVILCVGHA
jgi:hypothetical protein